MLLYSQNSHSQGARRLARALNIRRIRHNNSRFRGRRAPWVINWGASAIPLPWAPLVRFLNAPEAVERVSDKSLFFTDMAGTGLTPPATCIIARAARMIEDGKSVVERHVLNGHGGLGIRIVDNADELSAAPLYVEYIKKQAEYRVHVFKGGPAYVIDVQQKVARRGQEPLNWRVRSHNNGFIYQRENIMAPDCVINAALDSMQLTDLHFGAVDVIYNERQDRAYVLEINTAPGLEGRTVQSYAQAIREFIR